MAEGTKEQHFEEDVVKYLTRDVTENFSEYTLKDSSVFDKTLCVIPEDIIAFVKDTQAKKYEALEAQYGADTDKKLVEKVSAEVRKHKTLHVLREGVKDRGQYLKLAFFKPAHSKSPEHLEWYNKNRLTVVRQLKYSLQNENSVDVVLFINGLPVVTLELKNALTGQKHYHAIQQFIKDRDPKETLFEFQRCIVHFAVGTEKVSMCTKIAGKDSFFLPFNTALVNENKNGFATAFLWEDVLTKDSLMDLVHNFVNLQTVKEKYYDTKSRSLKEKKKQVLIFPRFHQRRAVKSLLHAVKEDGVGSKYLIQHSAGSGKSNTISWLAHRLSDLYRHEDDNRAMFDSTIVVTDRRVLDKQIQDNIKQFEQTPGAVAYIDKNKTSQDLKDAIEANKRVIVTTLQKFPVISEIIGQNTSKKYAVIIDEAHSSQSGESARHLRKALSLDEAEEKDVKDKAVEEIIEEEIRKKGVQPNISFFAFTATPKPKTVELFGTQRGGQLEAFDKYTMEQAIKEGFILDVLKNYVSWKRYYKLIKRTEIEDKEYDKKKTVRLLSTYVDLQDHAIEKKSRVMLEHFVSKTQNEIQGKARAMLVTKSRLHAVRYKRKFDALMREMKLPYKALVAFSGTVTDSETGMDYTMENMNELGGKISVPDALKLPENRILIVANMYQTGFDEPLLHTMFVDKILGGAGAVQTLSRLNRTTKGKNTTMVLDFVNDTEKIQESFQEYYGSPFMELDNQTDPNSLYDVLQKVEAMDLVFKNDLQSFAELFFKKGDHKEKLQPILNGIVSRFTELEDNEKIQFKGDIRSFVRLYRFLSQIITFTDVELEKWYVLLVALQKKLPSTQEALPVEVLDEIDLDSYKLQHQFTTDLELESSNASMDGMSPSSGGAQVEEEFDWLTNILKVLNETFGLDLDEEEKEQLGKLKNNIYSNTELMSFFNDRNSKENIKDKFNEEIDDELLNFINTKLEFYNKLTEDKVNQLFKTVWFNQLYDNKVRGFDARG
jgi:type I restriction enzyme R subunit